MNLTRFISEMLQEGKGTVPGGPNLDPIAQEDAASALLALEEFHRRDALSMPGKAPEFHPEAALWGATFAYRSVQFILQRHLDAAQIPRFLPDWPHEITPRAIYSVDLCLRQIAELHHLARGLAPGDPLVKRLTAAAVRWPFSSVGMKMEYEPVLLPILDHASLRMAYVDRIIACKDKQLARLPRINELVHAALGQHASTVWPDFQPLENKSTS